MNTAIRSILGFGLCSLFYSSIFAADITAGEQKASVCFGCHGQEGNSSNPQVPILAGQQAAYLVNQITAFRDNKRVNPVMLMQAKGLSDSDINNVAAYFASRKPKQATGNTSTSMPGAAKATQCSGCHSAGFVGRGAIPKLSGQHPAYLARQLRNFKTGERKSGPMQAIAANLSDADIEQLTAFLGAL
ncbi:MAG: c-type cytochrome [Methylococcales bacterium]